MKKYTLNAQERTLVGRKVKQLRSAGSIPASVYGKKIESTSVTIVRDDFIKVYRATGESGLVELTMDHQVRPVLIHNVQKDALSGYPLHVEFYQVDLKEKVKAHVPIEITGEAQPVKEKQGVLLTILDEVEVEALPTELPEKIVVDVAKLTAVNQELKVSELKVPAGVTILTDPGLTIVKIGALVTKEAEAEAAAEAAAAAAAAAESAAAGGATPTGQGAPSSEAAPAAGKAGEASEKTSEEKKS